MESAKAPLDERLCPTCNGTDLILAANEPIDGTSLLSCKRCGRWLELGRPGVGPLIDPEWKSRSN